MTETAVSASDAGREVDGVLILGGAHGALAVARSLGRKGVPVALVTDDFTLVCLSRYIGRRFSWKGPTGPDAVRFLLDLAAKHRMQNWLLVPGGDAEVRLIAENRDVLASSFNVMSSRWRELETLCNKQQLAARAQASGVASPTIHHVGSEAAASTLDLRFPVVLKPAQRETRNVFTQAKAWRADNREQFLERYRAAANAVGDAQVVVQELVPGGGEAQFSYVALWRGGKPFAAMTARRTRQYPVDFSYTSTFVEVVDRPEVLDAAEKLLASIAFEGLVEVEFKYDARVDAYKVLDVNPRAWTWIGLTATAGMDLPWLMLCAARGQPIPPPAVNSAMTWVYTSRDLVAATHLVTRGDLSVTDYLRSLRSPRTYAVMAADDLLPGLLEIPLTVLRVVAKRLPARRGRSVAADSSTGQARV
jgi:predicted ATP-grasp superfamily ATP-dependent carboligase